MPEITEGGEAEPADEPAKKAPADDKKAPAAPKSSEDALAEQAQRLRDTAKWLVAAFASVGALVLAGLELKDIGALTTLNTVIAVGGVAIALFGVTAVILSAAAVLAAGRIPLTDVVGEDPRNRAVAAELNRNPILYQPFDNVTEFNEAITRSWGDQTDAWLEYQKAPVGSAAEQDAATRYKAAGQFLKDFGPVNRRLLATAEHENVRAAWNRARRAILVGVIAIVLGATAFAAVSPPEEEKKDDATPTVASAPSRAFLSLNDTGRKDFEDVLGADCEGRNLPVIALSKAASGSYELVTDPVLEGKCAVARIDVSDGEGEVTGEPLPPFEQPD